ncbi:PilZ domain-containing protein [Acidobacteria bacterium AH-259-G07]|nr:PilZ domain-containing protein [Acidobacteria bacterium AH-259-G07]
MTEQVSGWPSHGLQVGWAVSISPLKSSAERVATVTKTSPDETWLKLLRPLPLLFRKGELVGIKHWDEGAIYYWGGDVLKVSGSCNQNVAISKSGPGVKLWQRKYSRLCSEIPFSFRVISSTPGRLVSGKVVYSNKTQNISAGGIAFETELPLKVGDELQLNLKLLGSQQMSTGAWVVRSEKVEREERCLNSVALEFLGLKPGERAQFLRFLAVSQTSEETEETAF